MPGTAVGIDEKSFSAPPENSGTQSSNGMHEQEAAGGLKGHLEENESERVNDAQRLPSCVQYSGGAAVA